MITCDIFSLLPSNLKSYEGFNDALWPCSSSESPIILDELPSEEISLQSPHCHFLSSPCRDTYEIQTLILKRCGIPDCDLILSRKFTICQNHYNLLSKEYPVTSTCVICKSLSASVLISPKFQDPWNTKFPDFVAGQGLCDSHASYFLNSNSHYPSSFSLNSNDSKLDCLPFDNGSEELSIRNLGGIWLSLNDNFLPSVSSVPSLKLLSRGVFNNRPLYKAPGLKVKDAIEIRKTMQGLTGFFTRDQFLDHFITLGIIDHGFEFRNTSDACMRFLGGIEHSVKARFFMNLSLTQLKFFPDEGKSQNLNECYLLYKDEKEKISVLCLACSTFSCSGCKRLHFPSEVSSGHPETRHWHYLLSTCRLCHKRLLTNHHRHPLSYTSSSCDSHVCKLNFKERLRELARIDVTQDLHHVHPHLICGSCRSFLQMAGSKEIEKVPEFHPHIQNSPSCPCHYNLIYASAKITETNKSIEVLVDFSPIQTLQHLSLIECQNGNYLTVQMALEILSTFSHPVNRKNPDLPLYFKYLTFKNILLYPLRQSFYVKAKSIQNALTALCDVMVSKYPQRKEEIRQKINTLLSANYHRTDIVVRNQRKILKFSHNGSIKVMCTVCPTLTCTGDCLKKESSNTQNTKNSKKHSGGTLNGKQKKIKMEFLEEEEELEKEYCKEYNENIGFSSTSSSSFPSFKKRKALKISTEYLGPSKLPSPSSKKFFVTKCKDCHFYFRRENMYLKHLETCKPLSLTITCSDCQKIFNSEMGFYRHFSMNMCFLKDVSTLKNSSNSFAQSVIHFSSLSYSNLREIPNMESSFSNGDEYNEPIICNGCKSSNFSSISDLHRHNLNCESYNETLKSWECSSCQQKFINGTSYAKHLEKCKYHNLPQDLKTPFVLPDGRIECPGCKKVFFEYGQYYVRHVTAVCKKVQFYNFPCTVCSLRFSTLTNLENHECSKNTEEKQHQSTTIIRQQEQRDKNESVEEKNTEKNKEVNEYMSDEILPYNLLKIESVRSLKSDYVVACKYGSFNCPLCETHFYLNQPYGNHVRNTECLTTAKESVFSFLKQQIHFASLKINEEGTLLETVYNPVPCLRILCREILGTLNSLQCTLLPAITIKEGIEVNVSLTNHNYPEKLWQSFRKKSFFPNYGSYSKFVESSTFLLDVVKRLEHNMRESSGDDSNWIEKMKCFLSIPYYDHYHTANDNKYKLYEYPSHGQIRILCINCSYIGCSGCPNETIPFFSSFSDFGPKSKTKSQNLYFKAFGIWKEHKALMEDCKSLGKLKKMKRVSSVLELIEHEREEMHNIISSQNDNYSSDDESYIHHQFNEDDDDHNNEYDNYNYDNINHDSRRRRRRTRMFDSQIHILKDIKGDDYSNEESILPD